MRRGQEYASFRTHSIWMYRRLINSLSKFDPLSLRKRTPRILTDVQFTRWITVTFLAW
jgi:hypothetical protein